MSRANDALELYDLTCQRLREKLAGRLPAEVDEESIVTSYAYWVCTATGRDWESTLIEFAEDARQRAVDECEAERREIEILRRELAGAQGPLLDVGAGWGRMVSLYRELGLHSVCIEPDPLGVCLMRRDGVHRVARATGEALPFVAGAFSTLVLGWVVHHNSPKLDAMRIMAQLRRVAAPGATLISIEPLSAKFDEAAWMGLLEGAGFEVDHVERFFEIQTTDNKSTCYALARAIRRAEA